MSGVYISAVLAGGKTDPKDTPLYVVEYRRTDYDTEQLVETTDTEEFKSWEATQFYALQLSDTYTCEIFKTWEAENNVYI